MKLSGINVEEFVAKSRNLLAKEAGIFVALKSAKILLLLGGNQLQQ